MLLGFISLLLTVLQSSITKICVKEGLTHHFLPCKLVSEGGESSSNSTGATSHYQRLLAEATSGTGYCAGKKMVPLLSVEALHHLHVFIFVLGFVHVTCTVLTVVIGTAKIRQYQEIKTKRLHKCIRPRTVVESNRHVNSASVQDMDKEQNYEINMFRYMIRKSNIRVKQQWRLNDKTEFYGTRQELKTKRNDDLPEKRSRCLRSPKSEERWR
ncbi:MLO-like protein 1 [Camellia sinensis]|uniref:MLO-like protein 1 n=1 Tax=Camellia sinensis TaxID=4442 RepID=UPI00103692C1|nr:MLO-like protein 1 [Camellia sinensis]